MSDSNADRNLLVGMLALQMDFVTRDQLVAAMEAWVAEKSKPIGRIMLDQGALTEDSYELLEALVQKHLEKHEHDATKSLAALSSVDSAVEDLTRLGDTVVTESLIHVTPGGKTQRPDETMPITDAADVPASVAGPRKSDPSGIRFRVLRPHAQGGLGQVSVARDEELNRDVAFKELHDRHADNPTSRSRFMLEAEVTGALEHPGIVPIYGLGQYGDGRPFYAMRFIRGDSLEEAIDRFHAQEKSHRDPSERELEFRKLLRRFIDVCNAMHYAHSRGVLHRDLKPGNIMLGKYGETLVVDWGLAKPMNVDTDDFDSDEDSVHLSSGSKSSPTLMGSVVGTPQYMSPEQASGNLEKVGTAADVYSLGATLYYLLTGKPPLDADSIARLLRKVREGDFSEPREINSKIPAPLNAVCLKAMALEAEDRYETPNALADDIEHWLADEPVSVHRESLAEQFGRWARRNRSWVAAAAAALVLVTFVAIVAALFINQSRREEKRQRGLAEEARQKEQEQRVKAEQAQKRAENNFDIAGRAVEQMLVEVAAERLADVPQMQQVRTVLLGKALRYYDDFRSQEASSDPQYRLQIALANHHAADILRTLKGREAESEASFRLAIKQLTALSKEFPAEPKYKRHLANSYNWMGELFRPTNSEKALAAYNEEIKLQRAISNSHPKFPDVQRELARSLMNRGIVLAEKDDFDNAKAAYDEAIQLLESLPEVEAQLATAFQELARCYTNRGKLLSENEQLDEAQSDYESAVAAMENAIKQDEHNREYKREQAVYFNNLSNLSRKQGELKAAIENNARAVERLEALAAPIATIGNELANSYNSRGAILQMQSREEKDDAAENLRNQSDEMYDRAAGVFRSLIKQSPQEAVLRDRLGNALSNRAASLFGAGNLERAAELIAEAILQHQAARKASPETPSFRENLRNDYWVLSEIQLKQGDHAAAAKAAEQLPLLFPNTATEFRRAAGFLARCIVVADKDDQIEQAKRGELRAAYGKRAVELLRLAIENGFDDLDELKKSKEDKGSFYMLQDRADFQQLLRP